MNGQRWITVGVVLGLLLLVFGLLLPAIQDARETARKSTSKNNLKQLGLAFHNYHDTHRCFPPGGIVREDGAPMNGWITQLIPFCEASPFYSMINFQVSWNHSENREIFEETRPFLMIPGVEANYTSTGYGLTHYLGNPHLLYRNSSVTLDQIGNGIAHTWMVGEVAGNYQPWGYPFNWRPLGTKLCDGPESFGHPPWDGGHFLFADGHVAFFSDDITPEILSLLAAAPPIPSAEQMTVPEKRFKTDGFQWAEVSLQSDQEAKNIYYARVLQNSERIPLRMEVFSLVNFEKIEAEADEAMVKRYPLPQLLFRVEVNTDINARMKETSMSQETTPEQFQSNLKTLESLQKQLIHK
ncbi:hypothetical protein Pan241w_08390 [Gimesia alba]|uniref:DUF1559 domain-containing protein n=1 Tax=Gimesia alba TaxID=2527973 RepID=A0A517RA72_9PLAN|nr:DUF1559 domain-containing protein [Gimesia alba]QDT40780.1 hypothetical protein Pan241w_08390 [Gimesia alba]